MISRTLSLAVALALFVYSGAQDVSPGVRYKKATPQVNETFKRRLLSLHDRKFSEQDLLKMFDKAVMCGPALYGALKRQLPDAAPSGKPLNITVPIKGQQPQEVEGRFYNTPDDVYDFAVTVQAFCSSKPIKTRRPTKEELDYYWAMIPYDIEEPILVAESSSSSLLFNGKADGRIFYVELIPKKHKG